MPISTVAQSPARKQKSLVPLAVPVPAAAQVIRFRVPDDLAHRLWQEKVNRRKGDRRASIQAICIEALTAYLDGDQTFGR